jgi:hypothetical protein
MAKQINVDITPEGVICIDIVGYSGADCESATAFIEIELGVVKTRRRKPEYYLPQSHTKTHQIDLNT